MLNHSPSRKSKTANRISTQNSSLDESLKNLMHFAQSEYGLTSQNQKITEIGDRSTDEMISMIKNKLLEFTESVKIEQIHLGELKKECRFLQDAFQAAKRLRQKSQGQDYLAILTAEATNEFFSTRVLKMRDELEVLQNQILTRKELQSFVNHKSELDKELSKKRVFIANLEKSIITDEKSLESQIKKYEAIREKDLEVKGELELIKSEMRELRSLKKEIEEDTKETEDWILKEKLKSILILNSENAEDNENELKATLERINFIKSKIQNVENDIFSLETSILEKKKQKIMIIENYVAISNKFDDLQKQSNSPEKVE